ncbi:MAG: PAS domain S-box protein [Syntrophomonadaceae bacterium]|nr:PAS domain S-box protein [Syntrophomonadaceae bacterium]
MNSVNKSGAVHLKKNSVLLRMLSELEAYHMEYKFSKKNMLLGETMYPGPPGDHPELFCCFSPELNYTSVNKAYCQVFNKTREELIGASILSLAQEQYHNEISNLLHSLTPRNPVIHAEYTWIGCEGKVYWREWIGRAIFDESGYLIEYQAIGQDVTERKQMEEELRKARNELEIRVKERTAELSIVNERLQKEIAAHRQSEQELLLSEARYRAIVEDQTELVIRALPDTTLTFVNEALARFFNKQPAYFIGNSLLANIVEADQSVVMEKLKSLTQEKPDTICTLRQYQKGGKVCWQEWTARAVFEDQQLLEYQAVGRDVTERKMAEEALARSEMNFKKLAETSPAAIFVFNQDRLLYMNSTAKCACNYSDEDISDMNPWDLVHPDYHGPLRQAGIARRSGEIIAPYEARLIGKDGSEMWGYLSADIIDYEGQEAILGIIIDISERKKMEEDLLKTSKLESLGILAGGIAHDFNNILTVISGNISLAKMIMKSDPELYELLNEVEKAAFQARDLTQQLLTFSKGGAPIKETASIQELLLDSTSFVLRGSNVSCNFAIPDELWTVSIDKGQISQVINNLIINADQAMPEGGIIKMSAENFFNPVTSLALQAGNYVKISIQDQGIGIPKKHLAKVFDPYFTTKQKGHGLGLATCYSIIKKHVGDIDIYSELGIGTIINVYLPASPHEEVVKKRLPQKNLFGRGKILVMDDEATVRETLGRMLKHLGYHIDFAANGQEAIEQYMICQQAGEFYDAVIMDLTIAGGMGGKEACNRLRQIDNQVKVLVSSGYSNDPVMADYKQHGFCGVIPKPYEIDGLNQILYEVIADKQDN